MAKTEGGFQSGDIVYTMEAERDFFKVPAGTVVRLLEPLEEPDMWFAEGRIRGGEYDILRNLIVSTKNIRLYFE